MRTDAYKNAEAPVILAKNISKNAYYVNQIVG